MPWDDRTRRRLKLRNLEILMAVIRAGSMGKAADQLNLSQPAVSKGIADLEHALGFPLLDRSRQGVEPTPYGLALMKRGVAAFDELRQSVQDIEFLADPTTGELRIGATAPVARVIISAVIDQLSRKHPRMTFHLLLGDTVTLYSDLIERKIELAIARITEPLPDEHLSVETLFHDTLVVAAAARNPWTRRRKIELAELTNEPWASVPWDSFFGSLVAAAFRAAGLTPPRLTVSSSPAQMFDELLATGRFLTVVPGFSLKLFPKNAVLKALAVTLPNTRQPIGIITLKNRTLSPLAQLFIDRVRETVKPLAQDRTRAPRDRREA